MTGRYVRKNIPLQVRRMVDQAVPEPVPLVRTPAASNNKQGSGVQQWAVWSSMSSSATLSPRSSLASYSRTSSDCSVSGNFTDRSSVCSFCEDEFDRQESRKVQELFDSINQILYENDTSGSCASHLCHECREWTTRFTHLRVVGHSEVTRCHIPQTQDDVLTAHVPSLPSEAEPSNLMLSSACRVSAESAISTPRSFSFHPIQHCSSSEEDDGEIIEQEGINDCKIHSDVSSSSISCLHQTNECDLASISKTIFSRVWSEVVDILQPLIQRYVRTLHKSGDSDEHGPDILVIDDELHDMEPVTQSSVNQRDVYTANHMLVLPDQQPSIGVGSIFGVPHLDGLLTISSKAIQARIRNGALLDAEDHIGSSSLTRPSSSVAPLSSRGNIKASERSTSARVKQFGRLKLAPIGPGDRLRTPNLEDDRQLVLRDVLRGVKMATITESQALSMTPRAGPRSGLLPPISRDEPPEACSNNNNNNNNNNNSNQKQQSWYRGDSAASYKDAKPAVIGDHEKNRVGSTADSRPGTSSILCWSDAPQMLASAKRSSTIIGFNPMQSHHHPVPQSESADVIGPLTITGSNVASTVKAEPQVVNAKNAAMHPTDRSRPASKWSSCRRSNTANVTNAEGATKRRTRYHNAAIR